MTPIKSVKIAETSEVVLNGGSRVSICTNLRDRPQSTPEFYKTGYFTRSPDDPLSLKNQMRLYFQDKEIEVIRLEDSSHWDRKIETVKEEACRKTEELFFNFFSTSETKPQGKIKEVIFFMVESFFNSLNKEEFDFSTDSTIEEKTQTIQISIAKIAFLLYFELYSVQNLYELPDLEFSKLLDTLKLVLKHPDTISMILKEFA
jgi:hypothetical protein